MKITSTSLLFALMIFGLGNTFSLLAVSAAQETETPAQHEARMAWWRAARFGMFIHWGPVSLTGKEISWSRANSNPTAPNHGPTPVEVYDNLYKKFDPIQFNADEWVGIAKSGGMKYMVLTAKHGDGFLLWNSAVDNYNIGATPFHRDVCAELAEAAHKHNERIGWYFSEMDWRDPDCRSANNDRFVKKFQAELRELLSNYEKIDLLWFDDDGRPAMWDPATTYPLVRGLQPDILINNRLEMSTTYQWRHQGHLNPNEDYYTPEQTVGAYDDQTPWETCMTLGTQWSWKPGDKIKSAQDVIHILTSCAGGDGNLLLDVGPMPNGRIEPRQVEVLQEVGAWLGKYGESIYATRGGPYKPGKWGASTRQGNLIYLHIANGAARSIVFPPLSRKIVKSELMTGGAVSVEQGDQAVTVSIASPDHHDIETLVKLELDGPAMDIRPVLVSATSK